ncbi:hypothetical protein FPHYL_7978 [Fusarium phyllophilum]|uniref:Uncharacterized protein n=1 Tax=Fusarium phyllophilum TaxID=47803 RepID=A0A8H5N8D8_9HYPO|nr:hypothetical protein FPHYL_7978 [Fusarium phyllophilum]
MVAWLKSRAETLDNERRSLADQLQALETRIQLDIDNAAAMFYRGSANMLQQKLEAKEAGSSIEDRFAAALQKKKKGEEAKPEETRPEGTRPEETRPEEERC